ncbi:hypothetical protein [Nocardia gipuzkoensis]
MLSSDADCRLYSRNRREITGSYPDLVTALTGHTGGREVVLDGKIIAQTAARRAVVPPAAAPYARDAADPAADQCGADGLLRLHGESSLRAETGRAASRLNKSVLGDVSP